MQQHVTPSSHAQAPRPLGPDKDRPFGLVLSGGGARGAFQVGVWKVLLEHPQGLGALPQVISGTSAGALNGALIAAGLSPDQMLEFLLDL
jgi:NTE family protein